MSSENLREELRVRIEHGRQVGLGSIVIADEILSYLKSQIEQMENPYTLSVFEGKRATYRNGQHMGYRKFKQDILSKLK